MDLGRMGTVSEQIVRDVARYDAARLRRVTASVVRLGLRGAPVEDPRLTAAIAAFEAGEWGDTPARRNLRGLVEELDEVAWDAQDAAERGEADDADYDVAFARARVTSAVDFALDSDPLQAALESAYEVQAGLDNLPAVEAALRSDAADTTD
jgi:hypothetical protein